MSRPQDPHRPSFPFGNPFRMILPKGSYLSPRLLALLNTFESTLAERLIKLKPKDTEDILSLSWMRFAVESLCEIHTDIKRLITSLELPVYDWDEKWIDAYLDNSAKLLDICNAFSSEISRLNQGHLFLQLVVHNLNAADSNQFVRASSSLDGWKKHISLNNPRLEKCFNILENFSQTLSLPKVKKSSKGKVLMRALYGVKVVTVFVCRILIIAFSGCTKNVVDFQVLELCMWSEAFSDFQAYVSGEIKHAFASGRFTALKELEAVDICVKKLYPAIKDGVGTVETIENSVPDLKIGADKLSQGLDSLAKEVDGFFQIVLTGRDALLCNLRVCGNVSNQIQEKHNVEEQIAL